MSDDPFLLLYCIILRSQQHSNTLLGVVFTIATRFLNTRG